MSVACDECDDEFVNVQGLRGHEVAFHPDVYSVKPVPYKTDVHGREKWTHTHNGETDQVFPSQLQAIANGFDPYDVFDDENVVHHGNDGHPRLPEAEIPWANWEGNLKLMNRGEHGKHHNAIPEDDLLDELKRLKDELGKVPSLDDMGEYGKYSESPYQERFGTWNKALEAAGLELNNRKNIPKSALLEEIRALRDELGKEPTIGDMKEYGKYSPGPYKRAFGLWSAAKEQALEHDDTPVKGVLADWS